MQLSVKGKQLDLGEALRSRIEGELPVVIGKYFDNPVDATVTLSKDAQDFRADIVVHVGKGILLQSHACAGDARTAFDRSEEHTSELQSLMRISYAVFCLKKQKKIKQYTQ